MATLQSQINILAASLAQLYDEVGNPQPSGPGGECICDNKFSLVKLKYTNPSITENSSFLSLPTYVLAMDIGSDFHCAQYDVSLGIYESTVDGHTFEYVVPEKYSLNTNESYKIDTFKSEFIHGTFEDTTSLKILFNFPQLINLGSSLTINTDYYTQSGSDDYIPIKDKLVVTDQITFKKRSTSTQQHSETIKKLRNMQTHIESQPEETCIDLVNENFESILYNNVYQLTENGNLTLREHTNHPLKKHLTLSQSDYIYILECDTNSKYHIE